MNDLTTTNDLYAIVAKRKVCELWPECACNKFMIHQQRQLPDESIVWDTETLSAIETVLFFTLQCVAEYCPDPKVKRYATVQLLNPYWDAQRRGEVLTEEIREEIRAGVRRR
jgi:hypothetical protein